MNEIKRFIVIPAIKTKNNELIPIWDSNIEYENDKMTGANVSYNNSYYEKHYNYVECIFDLKTKEISSGINLDFYPDEIHLNYKKNDLVYYEEKHRSLKESKIIDIIYTEYTLEIKRGKKIEQYYLQSFKDIKIDNNAIYAIKLWKPFYLLENGVVIEWEHQLYHKQ